MLFAGVAGAAVQQGDTEIEALFGYMDWSAPDEAGDDADVSAWFLAGGVGYFFTDNIRVAGAGMWASLEQGDTDTDLWALGASGKYHFMPANQLVPYAGGQILWASADAGGDDSADGFLWGPLAGVRYELNENNDVFVEFQYHWFTGDISDELVEDGFVIFAGIVHQFK